MVKIKLNGKGRFKAFALGDWVEWNTTYKDNDKTYKYTITGKSSSLDDFVLTEPVEVAGLETGTEVLIQNPKHDFPQKVVYEFHLPDNLYAYIEGMDEGVFSRQEYFYKRVKSK